jgi:hypothetical protein
MNQSRRFHFRMIRQIFLIYIALFFWQSSYATSCSSLPFLTRFEEPFNYKVAIVELKYKPNLFDEIIPYFETLDFIDIHEVSKFNRDISALGYIGYLLNVAPVGVSSESFEQGTKWIIMVRVKSDNKYEETTCGALLGLDGDWVRGYIYHESSDVPVRDVFNMFSDQYMKLDDFQNRVLEIIKTKNQTN